MGLFTSKLSLKSGLGDSKEVPLPKPSPKQVERPQGPIVPPNHVPVLRTHLVLAAPDLLAALKRLVSVPLPTVGSDYDAALEYEQAEKQALSAIMDAEFGKPKNY